MAKFVEGKQKGRENLIHENYRYCKTYKLVGHQKWICILRTRPKPFNCEAIAYTKKIDGIEMAVFRKNHNKKAHDKYDVKFDADEEIEWPEDYKIYLKGGFEVEKCMKLFKFFSHICK